MIIGESQKGGKNCNHFTPSVCKTKQGHANYKTCSPLVINACGRHWPFPVSIFSGAADHPLPGWSHSLWMETWAVPTFVFSSAWLNILRTKSLSAFIIQQILVECKTPCRWMSWVKLYECFSSYHIHGKKFKEYRRDYSDNLKSLK